MTDSLKERLMKKPLFLLRNMRPLKEANSRDLDVLDKEENIEKATKSLEINDNQECKFDINSFKAVFLTDTGSFIYRTRSLLRAKEIQKQVHERCKFGKFHKDWLKKNCTKEQIKNINDWLEGKIYEEAKEQKEEKSPISTCKDKDEKEVEVEKEKVKSEGEASSNSKDKEDNEEASSTK